MRQLLLSVLTLPLFVACAHVSKQDCLEKDWQAVGIHDGSSGLRFADMTKVAQSCSRFEMANPPAHQYAFGYEIGLKRFCVEDRGYSHGERGVLYPSVCGDADAKFPELVAGWKKGIGAYCNFEQGKRNAESGEKQNEHCDEAQHLSYFKGFENGARAYCSDPHNAFVRGKSGNSPFPYCSNTLSGPFESAYAEGQRLYRKISAARDSLANLDSKISGLKQKDQDTGYAIRDHERRIREFERDIETKEDETQRLEAELRKCAREAGLCADSHIDSLERQLRNASDLKSEYRRRKGELSLKLPNLFSDRTRVMLELNNLTNQRPSLVKDLSTLEDRDLGSERDFVHVTPKKQRQ